MTLRAFAPILPVRSVSHAVAYYGRLGFSARLYREGEEYAFLTRDHLELHLRHAPDLVSAENPCGVYFFLEPGTAAALEALFRTAGVAILSPVAPREWQMIEFVLSDPDGNLLRFGEPVLPPS